MLPHIFLCLLVLLYDTVIKGGGKMKSTTIFGIVVVIAIVLFAAGFSSIDWDTGTSLNVYQGRLKINLVQVKRIDGSTYVISDSQMRVIHGSMDFNDKVGELSGLSITGDMKKSDNGVWYLIVDYDTNTTCWIDAAETAKDPYVTRVFGADGDQDGFNEDYIEMQFGNLGALVAGEDKKEVEVSISNCPARSSMTFTSLTNAAGISTTAYAYYTCTGYIAGFSEGDLGKIAKIQLSVDTTGTNETYPDLEYFKLVHLKIGGHSYTPSKFGTYDLSNARFELEVGDQINHQGGDALYYAKNAGTLWATMELKGYCKFPAANVLTITVNVYFYQPNGVLGSVEAWTTTWTAT